MNIQKKDPKLRKLFHSLKKQINIKPLRVLVGMIVI